MDFIMPMAFLCGFVMGFLICFTGVGGGVLIIPAIVYFFDLDVSVAIGTASVYATLTKIVAGVEHVRIGNVNFRLFTRLSIAAVPGVVTAAVAVNYLLTDDELGGMIQESLRLAVIAAIFLSLLFMLVPTERRRTKIACRLKAGFCLAGVRGCYRPCHGGYRHRRRRVNCAGVIVGRQRNAEKNRWHFHSHGTGVVGFDGAHLYRRRTNGLDAGFVDERRFVACRALGQPFIAQSFANLC